MASFHHNVRVIHLTFRARRGSSGFREYTGCPRTGSGYTAAVQL